MAGKWRRIRRQDADLPMPPRSTRLVRSSALSVKEHVYVEAACAVGRSHPWGIERHIIPNVMAPDLIMVTAQFGNAILGS
jgi:peptide/nickel transport system permease protein